MVWKHCLEEMFWVDEYKEDKMLILETFSDTELLLHLGAEIKFTFIFLVFSAQNPDTQL